MLQDNEVINNSFEGARPLYPVFEAEKDAECSVYEALERFKLEYKKQYTLKSKKLRLDLVIKHDGFCYPIEVKPDLSSKKLMGAAIAQASSYASIIKQPVFIGPVPYNSKRNHEHNIIACIAGNFNVGFICISDDKFRLTIAEQNIFNIYPKQEIIKNKMYFVTWQGSKKNSHEVKPK